MAPTNLEKAEVDRSSQKSTLQFLERQATAATDKVDVEFYIAELHTLKREIMDTHRKILLTQPDDPKPFEIDYHALLSGTCSAIATLSRKRPAPTKQPTGGTHSAPQIKLPRIELPQFDGNLNDWLSFKDMFTASIYNNTDLSKAQKLSYLKSCLIGSASQILNSIQCTDDNYDIAWDLIQKRYQNDREIFFSILQKFTNHPVMQSESATGLRSLHDCMQECIRSLKNINVPVDHWDGILIYLMVQKLDSSSKRYWEQSLPDTSIPKMPNFISFLDHQARTLQAGGIIKPTPKNSSNTVKTANVHHVRGESTSPACKFCQGSHFAFKCSKFNSMTVSDRREAVKKQSLCFNCLRSGHRSSQCASQKSCQTCKERHHTMLHADKPASATNSSGTGGSTLTHHSNGNQIKQTLLATALIKIIDEHGQPQLCRALLDGGSNSSFITESCVTKLGLKRRRADVDVIGVGSSSLGTAKGLVSVSIKPHFQEMNESHHQVSTLILPKITGRLPSSFCNSSSWSHLQGLLLADPTYNKPGEIELLLGADIFWDILLDGKRKGNQIGSPIAIRSTLGWLVAGNLNATSKAVSVHYAETDLDLIVNKFWELESLPKSQLFTAEEKQFESHFKSTTTRDETGRFIVKLPIKNTSSVLGQSRETAVRRLMQLEKRLQKNDQHRHQYQEFMDVYESLGHMERVPKDEIYDSSLPTYYIPHHMVLKESSTTTKLRVVFDASAKTSTGLSLNDKLMVGPTIQDLLIPILMRFRIHPIALTADIEKMYRQTLIAPSDTNLQRIVWRRDLNQPITDYRLLTVTYGTASGAFHATRALHQLAEDERSDYPLAAAATIQDFYVDDFISGSSTVENAMELKNQMLELTKRGGLKLRKWSSNSSAVLESLPAEFRETQLPITIDTDDTVKTLGLRWNPGSDEFSFKVHLAENSTKVTKRVILSEISKVFDPLGFLSPTIVKTKVMLQQLWKLNLGWDQLLPQEIQGEWIRYKSDLHQLENLRISRCIFPTGSTHYELHGFCDASERAYAAVVYSKIKLESGEYKTSLITAKTRVAPTKQISLPRLELCGALLLSQLLEVVQDSLKIKFESVHAWSDSTVALAWIRGHPTRWKTFVANRVAEIQEIIPSSQWAHVRGIENPADCASRGIDPSDLIQHSLWWNGPSWLLQEVSHPHPLDSTPSTEEDEIVRNEEKKQAIVTHVKIQNHSEDLLYTISTLKKLKTTTAWCLRYINNTRYRISLRKSTIHATKLLSGPLSTDELDNALLLWVKLAQSTEFSTDINLLLNNQPIKIKSKLRSLNPFLDSSHLLRVGGRLRHANISTDQKNPIILPRHHRLTELLIQHEHQSNLHAGPQLLHSIIHQRFWIISAKDAIRHQIKKCVVCVRHMKATSQQFMADLPAARVTPSRPFQKCGIDYAGPFTVRAIPSRSKVTFKAYLSLFICLCTRAVHLEVVSSLSTEAFLQSLKRLIARRGKPTDIFSDCGTNFVGADAELKKLEALVNSEEHKSKVSTQLANQGIRWHFNPPGAPHFGGLWEAGVKSVKFHLYRIIGLTRLTFEELATIMTQIEACLNSRPLTPLSTDPSDLIALTPGHFLIGDSLTSLAEPDLTTEKLNRLTRWQLIQQMYQHFWRRWSSEFLTRLQQRPKWLQQRTNIKKDDMVLIKDENLPPLKWKLGRVIETHPGNDGLVRVATVRTADGEYKRPIVKLCLLPIDQAINQQTPDDDHL